MSSERITPTKTERKQYYSLGQHAAEFILDIVTRTREPGQKPVRGIDSVSTLEAGYRKKAILDFMKSVHPALPFVALQLIRSDVRDDISNPEHDIRIKEWPEGIDSNLAGDTALIIATGLNRNVTTPDFNGRRIEVNPDGHPSEVRQSFNWAASAGSKR